MTYHYSMIRFVPDTARGEFINLGAVAGDEEQQDWELRLISNFARAKAIDSKGFLPAAMQFAGELEQRLPDEGFHGEESLSLDVLSQLAGEMNNIIQLSPPTPIVAPDAATALDILFEELVLDPAAREFRFEKKHRAVRLTSDAYRQHAVPADAVERRARVETGQFHGNFDFAVYNGGAVQLVNCWSFQLPNQQDLAEQVKAWAWVVHELRTQGASVSTGDRWVHADPMVYIAAVCIPPRPGDDAWAFDEAQAAFAEISVEALAPEDAYVLGARAAAALGDTAHA
ncbi:MAG: hypothetical protein QOG35_764 [Solirubrobacteraceae bacterium]|jgi:hypothetical protein|nr:hypothetical protein [Solirubrobacteraceae bacterium]